MSRNFVANDAIDWFENIYSSVQAQFTRLESICRVYYCKYAVSDHTHAREVVVVFVEGEEEEGEEEQEK